MAFYKDIKNDKEINTDIGKKHRCKECQRVKIIFKESTECCRDKNCSGVLEEE